MTRENAAVAIPDQAMIDELRQEQRRRANAQHAEVLRLAKSARFAQYQIGKALKPMRDETLYRYIDPPYETWKAYVEQGLGFTHSQVLKWILVGEKFEERHAEKYGIERLNRLALILLERDQPIPADLDAFVLELEGGESARFAELTLQQLNAISRFGRLTDDRQVAAGEPASDVSEKDAALNANIGGDELAWAELVLGELHGIDVEIDVKPGKRGPRVHFSVDFDQVRTFMRLLPERGLIVDLPDSVEPHE